MIFYESDAIHADRTISTDIQAFDSKVNELLKVTEVEFNSIKRELVNLRRDLSDLSEENEMKKKELESLIAHHEHEKKELKQKISELNKIVEEQIIKTENVKNDKKYLECNEEIQACTDELEEQKVLLELYSAFSE